MATDRLIVSRILQVHEPSARRLGLDRLEEDRLILAFSRWAEGQIQKWIDYAKGALLFVYGSGQSRVRHVLRVQPGTPRCFGWWIRSSSRKYHGPDCPQILHFISDTAALRNL